jgi:hypothetical protein
MTSLCTNRFKAPKNVVEPTTMPSMCQCDSKITAVEKCGKTLRQSLAGVEGGSRLTLEASWGQWAIIEIHFEFCCSAEQRIELSG